MAMPTSAAANAGASLETITYHGHDHPTTLGISLQFTHTIGLVIGQHFGNDPADAQLAPHGLGRPSVVTRNRDGINAQRIQRSDSLSRPRFDLIAKTTSLHAPPTPDSSSVINHDTVAPSVLLRADRSRQCGGRPSPTVHPSSECYPMPSSGSAHPCPRLPRTHALPRLVYRGRHQQAAQPPGYRQRKVLAARLQCAATDNNSALAPASAPGRRLQIGQVGRPTVSVPVLSNATTLTRCAVSSASGSL